jgi:hypothetical protein
MVPFPNPACNSDHVDHYTAGKGQIKLDIFQYRNIFLFMPGAATTVNERYWTHQLTQIKQRAELKMAIQLARQQTKREEEE